MSLEIARLEVVALAVFCTCNDGETRPVTLEGKQAKQILGYITHIQGGKIRLRTEPNSAARSPSHHHSKMSALALPQLDSFQLAGHAEGSFRLSSFSHV